MEVKVLNIKGEETGRTVTLEDAIFGIEPNEHVMYLDVKQHLANKRQGTAKTKERNEVSFSTRKLFRQKGTGGARRGDIKSPLLKGGGTVFGPKPRDYSFKLNKKVKRLARRSALSLRAKEDGIIVVEDFNLDAPKTKDFKNILKGLNIADRKSLFLMTDVDKNTVLSARNLKGVSLVPADQANTYRILNAQKVVLTESGLKQLTDVLNA